MVVQTLYKQKATKTIVVLLAGHTWKNDERDIPNRLIMVQFI
jgi:hypothetical protein